MSAASLATETVAAPVCPTRGLTFNIAFCRIRLPGQVRSTGLPAREGQGAMIQSWHRRFIMALAALRRLGGADG